MADLCLLAENGTVAQRWEIGDRPVAVGRDKTADVTIHDDTLSRHHFQVWRQGESFLIKDLNSQNGTWIDGQRVRETTLRHDVCITAGRMRFMFSQPSLPPCDTAVALPAALVAPSGADRVRAIPDAGRAG